MNILYIHTHDSGRYFSPYGYAVPTPNLQRFAQQSVTFKNAFCANPTCSPSRVSLLTGQYPHSAGMFGLSHRGFHMEDPSHHMANYLSSLGFETVLSGVQHEAEIHDLQYDKILKSDLYREECRSLGDDYHFNVEDYASAHQAADYLRSRQPGEKPFFLSVGFINTHRKFPPISPEMNPDYIRPPVGIPDTAENRADMAGLMTALQIVDSCVGTVLDALKESGLEDETLVFFTTDHGIAYPRMKCNLSDGGIGVALIFRYPGMVAKGWVTDALVSQIDLFPTLCELLALPAPEWLEGVSLVPLLKKETDRVREELFAEVNYHAAYEPMRCVRTEKYKYIRYYDLSQEHVLSSNIDDGYAKEYFVQNGFLQEPLAREQLYDLSLDPCERVNLIHSAGSEAVLQEMCSRLEAWQQRTGDPLRNNPFLPLPKGAAANQPDAYSAKEQDFIYGT